MNARPLVIGVALLCCVVLSGAGSVGRNEMISTGGSVSSDGVWVSGMALVVRRGAPGVAYAQTRNPNQARKFTYLLLLQGDAARQHPPLHDSQSQCGDRLATSTGSVDIAGRRIEAAYAMTLDPRTHQATGEELKLNGKPVDLSKGRVFLVDLAGKEVTWRQVQADLPTDVAEMNTTAEVEKLSRELVKRLSAASKEVSEFVRRAGR